ncbi:MAG: hypothetical protein K2N48_12450 [Muribaculaceae bacterium]|nr:hypothetical protein [Muribaculaceae bacterium]
MQLNIKSCEVLADIRSAAWLEQELHPEADRHRRHQMADICETDNLELVWRVLGTAIAEIQLELTKILQPAKDVDEDNDLRCPREWRFSFLFRLPTQTLEYIREKIHEYLVAKVMADRTAVIIPSASKTWQQRAEVTIAALRSISATARPPFRPVCRPLWPM